MNKRWSFPDNESLIRSYMRLTYQLRYLFIWVSLKLMHMVRLNKGGQDIEFISKANKFVKRPFPENFHDSYQNYVEYFPGDIHIFDTITASLWWREKYILEAGSGLGQYTYQFAKSGAKKVIGVEICPEKVAWSKVKYKKEIGENFDFLQGSIEDLQFPDNEFDLAYSNAVFEHIADPVRAFKELHRVVKPGGELLLTVDYFHGPGGNHLYDYIFFPWATTLVKESVLCRYWTEKLQNDHRNGRMGFYASGSGIEHLGEGSEIQLNKWNSDKMEQAMVDAGWTIEKKVPALYLGKLPIIRSTKNLKYFLQGSGTYRLIKS